MTTNGILYPIQTWASSITEDQSIVLYGKLPALDAWEDLCPPLIYKYAAMFATKSRHMFSNTTLAALSDVIARFLEIDPIHQSQRTVEDCLTFWISSFHEREQPDFPLHFECFLRRVTVPDPNQTNWWIYKPHPQFQSTFLDLAMYFYYRDPKISSQFLRQYPHYNAIFEVFETAVNLCQGSIYGQSDNAEGTTWFNKFYSNLLSHGVNESADQTLYRMFVHPQFSKDEAKPRMRLKRIKPMNLSAVPCIIRRFVNYEAAIRDISALHIPHVYQRASALFSQSESHLYLLVEQTALIMKLTLDYYLSPQHFHRYKQHLHVLPRTATTCYLVATPAAMQVLYYCQLPQMEQKVGVRNSQKMQWNAHFMTKVEQPPIFPVLMRTWMECTYDTHWNLENIIGIQQILFTMIRWCYVITDKVLTNTWFADKLDAYSDYRKWEWVPNALSEAILSVNDAHYIAYYNQLFDLMALAWRDLTDLRHVMIRGKQGYPKIDDYLSREPCSFFAFLESYIFVQAPHAIRFDAIDMLFETRQRNPQHVELIATLHELVLDQLIENAKLTFNSHREQEWRSTWLTLSDTAAPLVRAYYSLCFEPHWSEEEVRQLVLSCRLAPRHPLGDYVEHVPKTKEEEKEEDPMDIDLPNPKPNPNPKPKPPETLEDEVDSMMADILCEVNEKPKPIFDLTGDYDEVLDTIYGPNELSSVDVSSADGDSSMDEFSYSSADEGGQENPPRGHLNPKFRLKRKRKSVPSNAVVAKHHKRQRINSTGDSVAPSGPANRRSYTKWNMFTQMLTRREVLILPRVEAGEIRLGPGQTMFQTQLRLEFFAAMEDCFRDRNMSTNRDDLVASVMGTQIFLNTLTENNHYVVYFGLDNLGKFYTVPNAQASLISSNYMTKIMQKVECISSLQYREFAMDVYLKHNCRLYFDHEVLYIPGVLDRLVSHFAMQSHQRQVLEYIFDQVPRQWYVAPTVAPPPIPDRQLMPPPPPRTTWSFNTKAKTKGYGSKLY